MVRNVANNMLTHLGYEPSSAKNGEEAIELYQNKMRDGQGFNLVIMDLTIPGGMGGKEAIQKILEIDPEAKVIVSSGYSNDPVMAKYQDYGFKAAVEKPYRIQVLGEEIHKVLSEV